MHESMAFENILRLVKKRLVFFAFEFVTENNAHDNADDTDDQAAEHRLPEAIYRETKPKILPDLAGQQKHACVNHNAEQSKRQDDERAGQKL